MRTASILAGALLAAASTAHAVPAQQTAEMRLAEALEGRVAGDPATCMSLTQLRSSSIVDRAAIVYGSGRTVWVNVPRSGAEELRRYDMLVTRTTGNQLCSGDVVQLYDSASRMPRGFVILGDFVPHSRVATAGR